MTSLTSALKYELTLTARHQSNPRRPSIGAAVVVLQKGTIGIKVGTKSMYIDTKSLLCRDTMKSNRFWNCLGCKCASYSSFGKFDLDDRRRRCLGTIKHWVGRTKNDPHRIDPDPQCGATVVVVVVVVVVAVVVVVVVVVVLFLFVLFLCRLLSFLHCCHNWWLFLVVD